MDHDPAISDPLRPGSTDRPPTVHRIHIGGADLTVEEEGQGDPALLLVHGFPLDRRQWRGQRGAFPGVRLLLPDLRGHGESQPSPPPYSMVSLAEDLRQILDHLAIDRVVLGGLSMGGYVAIAFAGRYPERLGALILLDTHARADTPEARQGRAELAARVREHGVEAAAQELGERLVGRPGVDPEVRDLTYRMILSTSVDGMIGALAGMAARPDSRAELSRIRCPTLIVVGSEDAITPPSMAEEMAAAIADSQLVEIPDAGHLAPLERPADTNAAIKSFLATL